MPEQIFDVIVVGTGMGGSSLGALSAQAGLKTLILEKNPRIGGACSYYEKDGFHVDFGTHLFTCGGEGVIGEVLRRVGARSRVEFVQLKRFSRILGLGLDVPLYNSLLSIFRTTYRIHHQLGIKLREMPDVVRLNYNFFRMPDEDIEKWDDRTMEEYVTQYSQNPGLMAITNVVLALYFVYPYWKTSAGEGAWASKAMVKAQAISYPKGGGGDRSPDDAGRGQGPRGHGTDPGAGQENPGGKRRRPGSGTGRWEEIPGPGGGIQRLPERYGV